MGINVMTMRDRYTLGKFMEDGKYLEPWPAGQSKTWRYKDPTLSDRRVAEMFMARYPSIVCTSRNVRGVREAVFGNLSLDDRENVNVGAAKMWANIKALERRIEALEEGLGVSAPKASEKYNGL